MDNSHNNIGLFPQMPVCEGIFQADVNSDFSLPDYKSEIRRLLCTKVSILPPKEYVGNSSAILEGDIIYKILYTGIDSALYCATLTDKYKLELPLEFNAHSVNSDETRLFFTWSCESSSSRVLAPRKLNIKAKISCRALALSPSFYTPNITGAYESGEVEKKVLQVSSVHLKKCQSEPIALNDLIPLDPQIDNVRIIGSSTEVMISECTSVSHRINIRGEAIVKLLYCNDAESQQALIMTKKLPFAEEIPCEDIDGTFEVCSYGVVDDEDVKVEENGISVELSLVLFATAQKGVTVPYIADAFSTRCSSVCENGEITVFEPLRCFNGSFSQSVSHPLTDLRISPDARIIDVSANAKVNSYGIENGKLTLLGESNYLVVYFCDGEYSCREISSPFRYESDTRINDKSAKDLSCYSITRCMFTRARNDGEQLHLDGEICFSVLSQSKQRVELLSTLALGDPLEKRSRGLTLCYPEKKATLWDVAKRYGESVEMLKRKNSLPDTYDISKKKYIIV